MTHVTGDALVTIPFLILRTVADRRIITAASPDAFPYGIRIGMTLAQAKALCESVQYAEQDVDRDRTALRALARWLMRFSPDVACAQDQDATDQDNPSPQVQAIYLDITGCQRVFGGTPNIVGSISASLQRLGIHSTVTVAPTPGAAYALAMAGKHGAIVDVNDLQAALDPLPPRALRIDAELTTILRHLGLGTIGQVRRLPREALPARFGTILLKRIDQALGNIAEPLTSMRWLPKIEASMDFDGSVRCLEAIWLVFQQLMEQVIAQLAARGRGARELQVDLLRNYAPTITKSIVLSRPSRDPKNLFNLFRCTLDDLQLPVHQSRRPVRSRSMPRHIESYVSDDGFSGMRITVPLAERIRGQQIDLLAHEHQSGQEDLDHLFERLRVRLGSRVIVQPQLIESHVPEHAWAGVSQSNPSADAAGDEVELPKSKSVKSKPRSKPAATFAKQPEVHRPLHLLNQPQEVTVMVTPSEDAEGYPAAFTYQHIRRSVAHWVGPERIAGRWWTGNDKTRDYFDVADPTGNRFWLFRVPQTGKWYLHGLFE